MGIKERIDKFTDVGAKIALVGVLKNIANYQPCRLLYQDCPFFNKCTEQNNKDCANIWLTESFRSETRGLIDDGHKNED